jgi:hypothetical protein
MARRSKSPSKVVSAQASKGSKKNSDCSANGRVGALYLLSKEKPAGMNRRAVSSAIGQKDSRYRDFYLGRIVNVNRLPERNRYRHTE